MDIVVIVSAAEIRPYANSWAAELLSGAFSVLLIQPTIELPLVEVFHVVIAEHLAILFSPDAQSAHAENVPLNIAGQPPSPQVATPARDDSRSADAKRCLVAIVRPLFLEELRTDDASDLSYA